MKTTVLNQPEVQDYYREYFRIFSVDIEGDLEITDFQGRTTTQKDFAFKQYKVRATPVLAFFDLDGKLIARHTGPPTTWRISSGSANMSSMATTAPKTLRASSAKNANKPRANDARPDSRSGPAFRRGRRCLCRCDPAGGVAPARPAETRRGAAAGGRRSSVARAEPRGAGGDGSGSAGDCRGRRSDIGARLEARLIEPSDAADDQSHNDSRASLYAQKRLYDFGRTGALEAAAESSVEGGQLRFTAARARHRIDIMQAFFDVLLADLEYARDNEAMAVAYVGADRTRDRNQLGQVSDIEKLKQEDSFEALRMRRYRAQARQRTTRAKLAQLLDRPDDLPSNLVRPQLPENDRPLPEYPHLVEAALARNPRVLSLKADLEAARLQIKAERAGGRPVVSGSLSATAGERDVSSRNPLEAELRLEIPLYEGERIDAGVATAHGWTGWAPSYASWSTICGKRCWRCGSTSRHCWPSASR